MALIPPAFLDCVTAIGFRNDGGEAKFSATGFMVGRPIQTSPPQEMPSYRVYLVTNRHVLEGRKSAILAPTGTTS